MGFRRRNFSGRGNSVGCTKSGILRLQLTNLGEFMRTAVCFFLMAASLQAAEPVALNPQQTVLMDRDHGRLILRGTVCLREGLLEMFLCKKQTKEHESIVTLDADASIIHAGLLALGAQPGSPVRFRPEFKPPTGQKIDIIVHWQAADGTMQKAKAQDWIRQATFRYFEAPLKKVPDGVVIDGGDGTLRYDALNELLLWFGHMTEEKKQELLTMSADEAYQKAVKAMFDESQIRPMKADFVFAGSGFIVDDQGQRHYQAEGGTVICVANFGDAMIDINVESSNRDDQGRSYEPYRERVPEVGTPVEVHLIPQLNTEPSSGK